MGSDQEDEEKMIEKIRKKRAKLLAKIPEVPAPPPAHEPTSNRQAAEQAFEKVAQRDSRVPITCFQQVRVCVCISSIHFGKYAVSSDRLRCTQPTATYIMWSRPNPMLRSQ